jgi:hypothetical protein
MEMLEILLILYDILAFWAWKLQLKLVVILACHFCNNNNCRDFCTSFHLYSFYCQPKIKLGFVFDILLWGICKQGSKEKDEW